MLLKISEDYNRGYRVANKYYKINNKLFYL